MLVEYSRYGVCFGVSPNSPYLPSSGKYVAWVWDPYDGPIPEPDQGVGVAIEVALESAYARALANEDNTVVVDSRGDIVVAFRNGW